MTTATAIVRKTTFVRQKLGKSSGGLLVRRPPIYP